MNKIFRSVLLTFAIALLSINNVWAQDEPQVPNQNAANLRPGQQMTLRPDTGSDLKLDFVLVKVELDGAVTISAGGKYWANAPRIAYDLSVDTTRGTYNASLVPTDQIDVDSPQVGALVSNPKLMASGNGLQSINPGIYSAQVKVQSLDPISIKVAETTNFLRWQVYANGTLGWISLYSRVVPG